jgi:hypothetical protein
VIPESLLSKITNNGHKLLKIINQKILMKKIEFKNLEAKYIELSPPIR